jgi:hypothetical protein
VSLDWGLFVLLVVFRCCGCLLGFVVFVFVVWLWLWWLLGGFVGVFVCCCGLSSWIDEIRCSKRWFLFYGWLVNLRQ